MSQTSSKRAVTIDLIKQARALDDMQLAADHSPFGKYLGIQVSRDDEGFLYQLPFSDKLVGNPLIPALHGGVVASFMETVAILELIWLQDPQELVPPRTVNVSVSYLAPARAQRIFARTEIGKLGKRIANVRVRAWQSELDKPIALLNGHFLLQ